MAMNKKVKIAALSIISNTALIVIKIIAGLLSGSVSIVSEAIHSSMDLVASVIAFISVNISSKPADEYHPYGHGKVESISGMAEGLLIFVAAFLIIKESILKIINPAKIEETTMAIIAMLISSAVNMVVSKILYKTAKEEDSMALEADALHLKTDVYTSLGVGIGLILIKITNVSILDPVVAILVACLIIKEAWLLVRNAFNELIDIKLSVEEEEKIKEIINTHKDEIIDFHGLKTRKSGSTPIIEFHITLNGDIKISEGHEIITSIERDLKDKIKNSIITIHVDNK